jgi:3-isopropylmalate/(R)-2-methylmalate dehydratase small subunit
MQKFEHLNAVAAPLLRANIDTDAIIPSREMKGTGKAGLAGGLFANWRYSDPIARTENPEFVLNIAPYRGAPVLLALENFGCGSSREHAVWALAEYGVRVVIAPSFGAIFYNNCIRNGILPVVLPADAITDLAAYAGAEDHEKTLSIDLESQRVANLRTSYAFTILPTDKHILLEGLDGIDIALQYEATLASFEAQDASLRPWAALTRN